MHTPLKYDPQVAITYLCARDGKLSRLIDRVGPFAMPTREAMSPFQMLLHAIVYQQITGKAADSIHKRLVALFPGAKPGPRSASSVSFCSLRGPGLAPGKSATRRL